MPRRLDEIIVFRQLTKGEVKQIADIMLREVFKRAEEKEIKIDVTERFKVGFGPGSAALTAVQFTCRGPGLLQQQSRAAISWPHWAPYICMRWQRGLLQQPVSAAA